MSCGQDERTVEMDMLEQVLKNAIRGLYYSHHSHTKTLGAIFELSGLLRDCQDLSEAAEKVVDFLSLDSGFENASFLFYDSKDDCLRLLAARGFWDYVEPVDKAKYRHDLVFSRDQGVAWKVFDTKVPLFVEDAVEEGLPHLDGSKVEVRSLACLPISDLGVICLSNSFKRSFEVYEKRELIILSDLIAKMLESVDLKSEVHASHNYVQRVLDAKLRDLLGNRDHVTGTVEYLEGIVRGIPQGLCVVDKKGALLFINEPLGMLLAKNPKDLLGMRFDAILARKRDVSAVSTGIEQGNMVEVKGGALKRGDGTMVPVDLFFHPLRMSGDNDIGGMLVFHDLRGQYERLNEMMTLEKFRALGALSQGVAHEFNNILAMVLGNVEVLKHEITSKELLERLEKIEKAAQDGAIVVERLQTYAGQGAFDHGEKRSNVREVTEDVVELSRYMGKDKARCHEVKIDMEIDISPHLNVAMPPQALKEVLLNLVINAVEAMPGGGRLRIAAHAQDGDVVIEVSDTGMGMSESEQSRVFDPFYTTKGVGASGLGLSVIQGLVLKAGGEIGVVSKKGEGTTFTIRLPITEERQVEEISQRSQPIADQRPVTGLKILVVDDEEVIVELLTYMLTGLGHSVVGETDPKKALNIMEQDAFDIVFTDLGMPQVSGFDIAEKAKEALPQAKVILITGWAAKYRDKDLRAKGIHGVLAKPFKLAQLEKMISELVNKGV